MMPQIPGMESPDVNNPCISHLVDHGAVDVGYMLSALDLHSARALEGTELDASRQCTIASSDLR